MATFVLTARGSFSLAASTRFPEGFAPTAYTDVDEIVDRWRAVTQRDCRDHEAFAETVEVGISMRAAGASKAQSPGAPGSGSICPSSPHSAGRDLPDVPCSRPTARTPTCR